MLDLQADPTTSLKAAMGGFAERSSAEGVIALFEFEESEDGISISSEKHYKLVSPEDVNEADLAKYRERGGD